jgi:Baseplate J-like protein
MLDSCNIAHPLSRQGTTQSERMPDALRNDYVKLDQRTPIDLIKQSAEFSKYIAYYGLNDHENAVGDWQVFFKEIYDFDKQKCLITTIEDLQNGGMTPHLGLFLAFLQLFKITQDNLNELTERHLKLFYEEVLQLKYKPAIPDTAIVFAELDKTQEDLLIEKGTNLLAGKDAKGQTRIYKTNEDVVINQAQVADLKTIFVEKDNTGDVKNVSIAQKANTADGIDEPIKDNPASWNTFGNQTQIKAEIGFAIASPIFHQSEGIRKVILSGFSPDDLQKINIQYTAPKGWQEIPYTTSDALTITIPSHFPAWVAFDIEKHTGQVYDTLYPILKITLKEHSFYTNFASKTADLMITISVTGCKNLTLSNDLGDIDPSKSFFPFGSRPVANSSNLVIGYPTAFNKYLTSFTLTPVSKPKPIASGTKGIYDDLLNQKVYMLDGGNWRERQMDSTNVLTSIPTNEYDSDDTEYNALTKNNFIKVVLIDKSFDFDTQSAAYTKYIAQVAAGKETPSPNNVPPAQIPELESLTLNYNSKTEILKDVNSSVFQIQPFGNQKLAKNNTTKLILNLNAEGTLCIGIEKLKKGQSVSLHFQLHESSGNPELELKPIKWFYLRNNNFEPFAFNEITKDTTQQLTTSGIIRFSLPNDAFESMKTILPNDKVWLIAVCEQNSHAYPKTISIKSQAIESIFYDQNNDTSHLKKGLDAGTITKLEVPIEGLKKIEQTFNSFGGRNTESYEAYITRTSELLRHKHRAWNIWDYERMILEEFSNIYKVKCISHSNKKTEYAPQNVLIVVIPFLENVSSQDILQPKVSIGEREKIKRFLGKYTSPFVKIEVINPVYEEIEVTAGVSLRDGYDKSYYADQLNEALKGFLSPWLKSREEQLRFDGELYLSNIINFIDELPYVDYIGFLEVRKLFNGVAQLCSDHIKTSNQSVILTSVSRHILDTNIVC